MRKQDYDDLMQDWCNSIGNTQELLQSCTKSLISWDLSLRIVCV